MSKIKIACALLLILAVSACGGGGGGGDGGGGGGDGEDTVVISSGGGGGGSTVVAIDLFNAPGVNGPPVEDVSTLLRIEAAFDELETAMGLDSSEDGSLSTLTIPTDARRGILNGYIRVDGRVDGEIIVGNLSILANFDKTPTTVSAFAGKFREFRITGPGSPMALGGNGYINSAEPNAIDGEGTIIGTIIETNLVGDIAIQGGDSFNVDATLDGGIYDNGGTLITHGTVVSDTTTITVTDSDDVTTTTTTSTPAFSDGEFAAAGEFLTSVPSSIPGLPSEPSDSE